RGAVGGVRHEGGGGGEGRPVDAGGAAGARDGHRRRRGGRPHRPQQPCYFHGMTPPEKDLSPSTSASGIRFGTSGWRAVLAEDFTFGNARRVVASIARVLAADGRAGGLVLVGYDTRFLAARFRADRFAGEAAAIFVRHGFPAQVCVRPVPTPVLAFEIRRRGAVGAVNFTASHNPPQYLGIKFSTSDGAPALPEITRRIES